MVKLNLVYIAYPLLVLHKFDNTCNIKIFESHAKM